MSHVKKGEEVLAEEIKSELSSKDHLKGEELLDILAQYTEVNKTQIYHLLDEGALSVETPASDIKDYNFRVESSEIESELIKSIFFQETDPKTSDFNIVANSPPLESFDKVELPKIYPQIIRLINSADSELLITNPYFDRESMKEINKPLAYAEKHDVEIKMLLRSDEVPEDPSALVDTLKHGELRKFGGENSDERYFLHSKLLIADGRRAYIGSANLTSTSLGDNSEIGVIIDGKEVEELKKYFDILWEEAKPVGR